MNAHVNTITAQIRVVCPVMTLKQAITTLIRKKEGNWLMIRDRKSISTRSGVETKYTPVSPRSPDSYACGKIRLHIIPLHKSYDVWIDAVAEIEEDWRVVPISCTLEELRHRYRLDRNTRIPIDMKVIEGVLDGNK